MIQENKVMIFNQDTSNDVLPKVSIDGHKTPETFEEMKLLGTSIRWDI